MFFEVTTIVAAVAVVLAITAETTAAMRAFFTTDPLLEGDPLWVQVMRSHQRDVKQGAVATRTPGR
jgi:hypothetical protein